MRGKERAESVKRGLLLPGVCLLAACSSLLPTSYQDVSKRWDSFEDAKRSFDQIVPYVTDLETVRKLGFDPFGTPNMQILNYSQVVRAVIPAHLSEKTTIPQGIADCMQAGEACIGYFMEPSRVDRKRVGNFMLDFFNFKRNTVTTGWKFGALIVVIDGKVVFKQWSGSPRIEETDLRRNPLGPLQGAGQSLESLP